MTVHKVGRAAAVTKRLARGQDGALLYGHAHAMGGCLGSAADVNEGQRRHVHRHCLRRDGHRRR